MPIARPASGGVHEAVIYRRVRRRKLQRGSAFDVISTREFYFNLVEMRFALLVRKQSCVSHAIRCRLSWLSVAAPDFLAIACRFLAIPLSPQLRTAACFYRPYTSHSYGWRTALIMNHSRAEQQTTSL